jgi:hypothetical protein
MIIRNEQELAVTREKLRLLEERVGALAEETDGDAHVRELTLRSLKSMMNQFREEIARCTARATRAGAGTEKKTNTGAKRLDAESRTGRIKI